MQKIKEPTEQCTDDSPQLYKAITEQIDKLIYVKNIRFNKHMIVKLDKKQQDAFEYIYKIIL